MDDSTLVNLRDFIYLDVERLKSLLAQLDQGLLTDRADASGSTTTSEAKAGVSIPALAEVGGGRQFVASDQSTETRTLHDFAYHQVEQKLVELRRLKRLPRDFASARLRSNEVRSSLSPVEYVLVKGRVSLNDFQQMGQFLADYNDIMSAIVNLKFHAAIKAAASGSAKTALETKRNQEIASSKLDDKLVKNIKKFLDVFLRDRLVVRVLPFVEDPNLRVVGPLRQECLRDGLEDVRFKFGYSPSAQWSVFGQVAAVPRADDRREVLDLEFSNELESGLQTTFSALLEVEDNFRVKYPEIAITPIAIYRD